MLTGKFNKSTTFPENDHRNFNADGEAFNVGETFSGLPFERGVDLSREVAEILPVEIPMAQAALRWILDHPSVTAVIPGASNTSQVKSNVQVSALDSLPEEMHQRLRSLYDDKIRPAIRGKV